MVEVSRGLLLRQPLWVCHCWCYYIGLCALVCILYSWCTNHSLPLAHKPSNSNSDGVVALQNSTLHTLMFGVQPHWARGSCCNCSDLQPQNRKLVRIRLRSDSFDVRRVNFAYVCMLNTLHTKAQPTLTPLVDAKPWVVFSNTHIFSYAMFIKGYDIVGSYPYWWWVVWRRIEWPPKIPVSL